MADLTPPSSELLSFLNGGESAPAPTAEGSLPAPSDELKSFVGPEVEDEQKYGGPQGALTAAAAHVVSSALPGVGIKGMNAIGIPNEEYEGLTRAHPLASATGDVAGFVRGAASRAISAIGKGVSGVASALGVPLESAASLAIQFGTEGGLFAGQNALNDVALGKDPNLVAQHLLTDVGTNAAFGAGLGVLSKGVEVALPAATKKLSNALTNFKQIALGTEEAPSVLTKGLSVPGAMASGKTPEEWISTFFENLKNPESGVTAETPKIDPFTKKPYISRLTPEKITEMLSGERASNFDPFTKQPFTKAQDPTALGLSSAARLLSVGLEDVAQNAKGAAKELLESAPEKATQLVEDYQNAEAKLAETLEETPKIDPFTKKPYISRLTPEKITEMLSGERASNFDPFTKQPFTEAQDPTALGLSATGAISNFVSAAEKLSEAATNQASFKEAEKQISSHVSEIAKENSELSELAKAMNLKVREGMGFDLAGLVGKAATAHFLGVPKAVTGTVLGALEAYKGLKNPLELGERLNTHFQQLSAIAKITEKVSDKVNSLSKSIFANVAARDLVTPKSSTPLPTPGGGNSKNGDRAIARIKELMSDPDKLLNHLASQTEGLTEAAPNVSVALHQSMISALQFLEAKIPKPVDEMPLSGKWEPSQAQRQTFSKYLSAVDDPLSALKQIKEGRLYAETVEALRAVHPHMLNEMQQAVSSHLTAKKAKNLPYAVKLSLAQFLGQPLDEGMLSTVIASNQTSFAGPQRSNQSSPKTRGNSTLGGLKQLNMASRAQTQTQDHEKPQE